ncbi:peroxiredoxin family protein [Pedobacter hartonius]|uniref:Peroxiredoxin n=1 Tax=Pedobacter hartonius TaxID=425514 RepID=A0A1H4ASF6_9SPHI|nr:TlpA disulfide reductase family protein [Pedobacter hartonius]SEA38829.1 Peroxiredoxin [Pedobacter hartonius]
MHHIISKTFSVFSLLLLLSGFAMADTGLQNGLWRASLLREDGNHIIFTLQVEQQQGKTILYVVNGQEKMLVKDVQLVKDSMFVDMPVFESSFKLKIISKDSIAGTWYKRGSVKDMEMPFTASAKQNYRFAPVNGNALQQVEGKWKIDFLKDHEPAIGNFSQKGNLVTGSVLTTSGDYRFLSGTVTGNLLQLSTFDGVHAILFTARVNNNVLSDARMYSGKTSVQEWTALKDSNALLPAETLTKLKDGENGTLDFSFTDLDGKKVSIKDERFKGKVVVIQLMGSWCPNCMDETAFMSEYYDKNKQRGIEMIGLAYEYSTEISRSIASVRKFQKRFNVHYPLLITPVKLTDPQRTEKTLPQLTEIKVFPTTLILDRSGKVVEITTDFFGPGTGEYYTKFKEEFERKMDKLVKNQS